MMLRSKIVFVFILVFPLIFSSCFSKNENEAIVFDNSEPLALLPDIKWAVIKDSYSAFHAEASWESSVNSYCRCGQICRIIGNKTVINSSGIAEKWIKSENGWIPNSVVVVCSNLYNARSVSESLQN